MSSSGEVRALYRGFLRVGRLWVTEESREGRSIKEAIRQRVRSHFREMRSVDAGEVPKLLQHGKIELVALQELQANAYKKKAW